MLSTQLLEGATPSFAFDRAELKVIAGPDRGTKLELGVGTLTIGSSPQCDLVLHDTTVSARHAEIRSTTNGFVLRDLGSTNRVLCGAQPIERAPLVDGMNISL